MAAPEKKGLEYYPRDVGLLKDRKFIKAKIKYGYLAIVVYDALLEMVYSDKGYYLDYTTEDNREAVVWEILDSLRGKYPIEAETIYKVIEMLVECRLFSHDHFEQGIITSKRIQSTYYRCTLKRKNVEVNKNIWLLTLEEMKTISKNSAILSIFISDGINEVNEGINGVNDVINSQSKVKESKVKESKVKESKKEPKIPTLLDIQNYCKEKNITINCERFFEHYEATGWLINGNPLVNWQARVMSWYKEDTEKNNSVAKPKGVFNNYNQKIYSSEEIEEILKRKEFANG